MLLMFSIGILYHIFGLYTRGKSRNLSPFATSATAYEATNGDKISVPTPRFRRWGTRNADIKGFYNADCIVLGIGKVLINSA